VSEDQSVERLSVGEAAERLGVTRDAIHKRIHRGTIEHEKGDDGRFYVYVDTSKTEADTSTDESKDKSKVEVLERLIARLEHDLEQADERDRENRRIIAMLTSRIPAIEAPESPEPRPSEARSDTPDAGGEAQEGPERRWWEFWR
jgi:excisionase family DNA binding protein